MLKEIERAILFFILGVWSLVFTSCHVRTPSKPGQQYCKTLPSTSCQLASPYAGELLHCKCKEGEWWLAPSPFALHKATWLARETALADWVEDWFKPQVLNPRYPGSFAGEKGTFGFSPQGFPHWQHGKVDSRGKTLTAYSLLMENCAIFHLREQNLIPPTLLLQATCLPSGLLPISPSLQDFE